MYPRSQPNKIIYTTQPKNWPRITYSSPYTTPPTTIQYNKQNSTQQSFYEPYMPNYTNSACNRVRLSQNQQESFVKQNIEKEMNEERMVMPETNDKDKFNIMEELKQQSCFQVYLWRILLVVAVIGAVLLAATLLGSKSLYQNDEHQTHHRMRQFNSDHITGQDHHK